MTMHDKRIISAIEEKPKDKVTGTDRCFLINIYQFLIVNIIFQIVYFMYYMKIGLNQDKFSCIAVAKKTEPVPYKNDEELKDILDNRSAVDVTEKYGTIFELNLITYILLDLNIIFTLFQYRRSVINPDYNPDYTCTFCFFGFFLFFGIVELIMVTALRFSPEGRICSGDFLDGKNPPKEPQDMSVYYMRYEGLFVILVVSYEFLSVVLFLILKYLVNNQRFYDNMKLDGTYAAPSMIQQHSRSNQLILNQLKFTPKTKYPSLKFIYDINDYFNLHDEIGNGTFGTTWKASKIEEVDEDGYRKEGNNSDIFDANKCVIKQIKKEIMDKN